MEGNIMGRRKGSKNKKPTIDPLHTVMTAEERLDFLARLIVERIEEDQTNGQALLAKSGAPDEC